jgi:hypothetical protein
VFHKTGEACCLSVCHFRENGNPSLLKNSFYIVFLKEIMLETVLILKMDPHPIETLERRLLRKKEY